MIDIALVRNEPDKDPTSGLPFSSRHIVTAWRQGAERFGWNDRPVLRGRGSAIFWHLARPGFTPTAGCVAVDRHVFAKVLPRLARHCRILVR